MACLEEGLYREAADAYAKYVELRPDDPRGWFNRGLAHKFLREWPESARFNQRSVDLQPTYEGWWNLGIAATALRDWVTARRAWSECGVGIPQGDGPLALELGPVPIRLDPTGSGEVVWCDRIDPARAVVRNVPLADSGRRWGECVLHDGVPNGERIVQGMTFPVFDEIELWEASSVPTLAVDVEAADPSDSERLVELVQSASFGAEDWSKSVRMLCRACSEGRAHEFHDQPLDDWDPHRHFAIAAPRDLANAILRAWASERPSQRRAGTPEVVV